MPRGGPLRQPQTGDPEERLLVERAKRDPARFADLYDIYFDRIYAYVARRVISREETEDLVSEVFHKALANLRRFEWQGAPFSAWLFRIAANEIAEHAGVHWVPRVLHPPQSVQTAKERHLNRAAPIYEDLQVVPLAMYPEVRSRRVQISEKGQPRLQPIWVETRRREEVKVFRHPMAKL